MINIKISMKNILLNVQYIEKVLGEILKKVISVYHLTLTTNLYASAQLSMGGRSFNSGAGAPSGYDN